MTELSKPQDLQKDWRPIPDPSLLTTEQLMREITRLEAVIALQIAAVDERLTAETNLTGSRFQAADVKHEALSTLIDERTNAAATGRDSIRETLTSRMVALEKIRDEKFGAVFSEHAALKEMLNERYATQTKQLDAAFTAQQTAMQAALQAAKEAVEKANTASEKRFDNVTELLNQQNVTIGILLPRAEAEARITDLDRRIGDLKSTVDKGFTGVDVRHVAGKEVVENQRGNVALVLSGIAVSLTLVLIVVQAMHLAAH